MSRVLTKRERIRWWAAYVAGITAAVFTTDLRNYWLGVFVGVVMSYAVRMQTNGRCRAFFRNQHGMQIATSTPELINELSAHPMFTRIPAKDAK